jgi:hypothetical protein
MRFPYAAVFLLAATVSAQPTQSDRYKYAPLLATAKLWNMIRYLHPQMSGDSVAWDNALFAALPSIEAAHSDDELAIALDAMLATLNDPCTRIAHGMPGKGLTAQTFESDKMVIRAGNGDLSGSVGAGLMIKMGIPQSSHIVWDLRGSRMPFSLSTRTDLRQLSQAGIGYAFREHSGYAPQDGNGMRRYYSSLQIVDPQPVATAQQPTAWRQLYLVDKDSAVPVRAIIDQIHGRTAILSEDPPRERQAGYTELVALLGKVVAEVRMADIRYPDGSTGFAPTRVVLNRGDEAVKATISAISSAQWNMPGERPKYQPTPAGFRDMPYSKDAYPQRPMRILAAIRIWGVLRYFHPYTSVLGNVWDDAFIEFLPRFAEAKDAAEYHRAVAEMVARTGDPGSGVGSAILDELFGPALAPFEVRFIEGQPVITSVVKASEAKPGDVIVAVEGTPVQTRIDELLRTVAGPTRNIRLGRISRFLVSSKTAKTVKVRVKRPGGEVDLNIALETKNQSIIPAGRAEEAIRMLVEKTGYADLERVEPAQVDGVFEKLKTAAAIVFDLRGSPRNVAPAIAARLGDGRANVAAELFRSIVGLGSGDGYTRFQQGEVLIPKSALPRYKGKVVALIEDHTPSLGGEGAMYLKAAGAVLVGETTFPIFANAGTVFDVPGGIKVVFGGEIPRWPGGGLLQPAGIVPDVEVRRTLAGVREKRDEALEAAVAYLKK